MDLFKAMEISGNGLQAQRTVLGVVSTNLANVHTTRTDEGGPYRRKRAVLSSTPIPQGFEDLLSGKIGERRMGVKVDIVEDRGKAEMVYDPSHPDADEAGYVAMPSINAMEEMNSLLGAMHSYEANVTAFNAAKSMALKSLDIGK